jgi:hypothetical protein
MRRQQAGPRILCDIDGGGVPCPPTWIVFVARKAFRGAPIGHTIIALSTLVHDEYAS